MRKIVLLFCLILLTFHGYALDVSNNVNSLDSVIQSPDTLCGGRDYLFVHHTFDVQSDTLVSYVMEYFDLKQCLLTQQWVTVIPPQAETHIYDTICYGSSYTWNSNEYRETNTYEDTLTNIYGCDSIVVLHLTVMPEAVYDTTTVVIGSSTLPYKWRGQTCSTTGVYEERESFEQIACDSAVHVLDLTVYISTNKEEVYDTICYDALPYKWYEQSLDTSGTYTHTEQYTGTTIDSIQHILYLTVLPKVVYKTTDSLLCYGVDCNWRNKTYNSEGQYNDTVRNQLNCDSIIYILNLKYLPDVEVISTDTLLCYGVNCNWRNTIYTQSGTYSDTVRNQLDCDSIIYILNLFILPATEYIKTDTTLCFGETCAWRDMVYKQSGTYADTVRNCLDSDSLVYTLNLTILPEIPITEVTDTMAGSQYLWNEQVYEIGGDYRVTLEALTGCDSVVILHLVDNPAAIDSVWSSLDCAGSGILVMDIQTSGFIESLKLEVSDMAQAAGLKDTMMAIAHNNEYEIPFYDVRAGAHPVDIVAFFHQKEVARHTTHVSFMYPNTIFDQQFNDLLAVLTKNYNGGYDFTHFQWYKDGIIMYGETHSYIKQPLSFESEYTVLLTDPNGIQLMSCPYIPVNKGEIVVYPTIVQKNEAITCLIPDVTTQLRIYDMYGHMVNEILLEEDTKITLPNVSGIYILHFVTNEENERQIKVIVQ